MSKHNYSQYSNKKYDNKSDASTEGTVEIQNGVITNAATAEDVTVTTLENKTVTDTDVTVTTLENKTTTETEPDVVETVGTVANCAKLNVRLKPSVTADVVTVLNAGDEISIDVDKSTDEWFKIRTTDGVNGYCMRKFVNANI